MEEITTESFSCHNITEVNGHIVTTDGQKLVVDTGSPKSFHKSGRIYLGEGYRSVPTSLPGVTDEYLTRKIGCEVDGLLGMDIIGRHVTWIDLKTTFLMFNDNTIFNLSLRQAEGVYEKSGLYGVEIYVNGRSARMIVDSGARISYISKSFVSGMDVKCIEKDFSPFIGDFETPVFECETDIIVDAPYFQSYGIPPAEINMLLETLNVDGILGMEFFRRYRLLFVGGKIEFPPQGI